MISNRIKISKSNDIIFHEIEDEIIILNLNNEAYIGLDIIGTHFWKILLNSDSTENSFEQLLSEYDVNPETLKEDLEEFIDELDQNGLIDISNNS